jgi:hypothetical protein
LRGRGARPAAAGGGGGDAAERAAGRPVAAAGAAEVARLPHVVVVEVAELGLPAPTSRARQRLARARGRRRRSWERRRERSRRRRSHRLLRRRGSALLRDSSVGVWRLDDLAEELESSCVGVHGPRVSLCLTQLTPLCDRSPVLIRHGHIMHGYVYVHDIVKSGLEHGPWHGASQKKHISWGNAEKRASHAAKRFGCTGARTGTVRAQLFLPLNSSHVDLTFSLLLFYIELDMVKRERPFYKS